MRLTTKSLLTLGLAAVTMASPAFAESAPDQKQYNGLIKNVHDGYQAALTKNGTDARYNQGIKEIDRNYNQKLSELGFGPSHTMTGHFGKGGIQTDKAHDIGGPDKDKNAPDAAEPVDWTASGSIGIVKQK